MAEAAAVRLRHITWVTSGSVIVAQGRIKKSVNGVVECPVDEPLNILDLWYKGYRIDDETGVEIVAGQVDAFIEAHQPEPEPVESDTDDDEDDEEETEQVDAFVEALEADADPED